MQTHTDRQAYTSIARAEKKQLNKPWCDIVQYWFGTFLEEEDDEEEEKHSTLYIH